MNPVYTKSRIVVKNCYKCNGKNCVIPDEEIAEENFRSVTIPVWYCLLCGETYKRDDNE